ncbi:Fic family protein [Succinimonas amylolytica]|uniref:Fic family protein n=1 Tax=Succinimonas amylolytica TaxID=83769 RepID=UPI0003650B9F|nr:Fic family protein [Succinimonas amylolytica]
MANLKDFRMEVKINFVQSLLRFEGIDLTDIQTEKLLNNDNFAMLEFPEEESLVINNVINTLNYMESLDLSKQAIDLDLYIRLNSSLAKNQALATGALRNGLCSIPCIGEIPLPEVENVKKEISSLNNITKDNYKSVVSECFCNLSKLQPFWDGNKRTTLFLCNTQLIKNDFDLLAIQKDNYAAFEEYLTDFYTASDRTIVDFLVKNCFIKLIHL